MLALHRLAVLSLLLSACDDPSDPGNSDPDSDPDTTVDPDTEDPDTEDPDTEDPDTEDPDTEDPDTEPDTDFVIAHDDVMKVKYQFYSFGSLPDNSTNVATLTATTMTDINADPSLLEQAVAARRDVGGDCVAYVDTYNESERGSSRWWIVPSWLRGGGAAIPTINGTFQDQNGGSIFFGQLTYDTATGIYSGFQDDTFGSTSVAASVTIGTSGGPINGNTAHTVLDRSFTCDSFSPGFSLSGFSHSCQLATDTPGMYMDFILDGPTERAFVVCAAPVVNGSATINVPSLADVADEIGFMGLPLSGAGEQGPTTLTDPYLIGHYGVIEQATAGPSRVIEGRVPYNLGFL